MKNSIVTKLTSLAVIGESLKSLLWTYFFMMLAFVLVQITLPFAYAQNDSDPRRSYSVDVEGVDDNQLDNYDLASERDLDLEDEFAADIPDLGKEEMELPSLDSVTEIKTIGVTKDDVEFARENKACSGLVGVEKGQCIRREKIKQQFVGMRTRKNCFGLQGRARTKCFKSNVRKTVVKPADGNDCLELLGEDKERCLAGKFLKKNPKLPDSYRLKVTRK